MKKLKRLDKADVIFGVLLTAVIFIHLSRIRLGNVDIDEGFYLTVPYRLAQGESLLADEWHVSQLVGFLLYPFVKCYLLIHGNTEGIYLASRYVYLACLTGSAIVSYILLRKRNRYMAAIANIMFALFTHACLRTLSYNTIGMLAVWLMASVLMADLKAFRFACLCSIVLPIYDIGICAVYDCLSLEKTEKRNLWNRGLGMGDSRFGIYCTDIYWFCVIQNFICDCFGKHRLYSD